MFFLVCLSVFTLTACRGNTGIGTDCNTGNDCESNACATRWPNGYCTKECTSDSSCGTGGKCISWGDANICVAKCEYENECRPGYFCAPLNTSGHVCVPLN
jgi:hypothetical protein